MLWRMEQKGFNHQAWHWMNINIMPFTFHHGELQFSHNVFVSSKWTQRIKFLVNFIALHWTTLLVRLQLHSSSTSKQVLWVHIFMLKVCKNASQWGRVATKSPRCENSRKCGSIKFERNRLQDERAPLAIRVPHHEDVMSTLNLKITPGLALCLLVQLEARKTWPYTTP